MPRKGMRSIFSSPNRSELSGSSFPTPSRSFTKSLMAQILEQAEPVILKWDEDSSVYAKITSLFYENRREARDFIKQVNDLHKAMHTLVTETSSSQMLVRAQILMQMAMKRLQKEFYQILSTNRAYLDPESISTRSSVFSTRSSSPTSIQYSTSGYGDDSEDEIQEAENLIMEVEDASVAALTDLVLIVECMISSGYGKECVNIYKIMRKSIVDEGLYKLGVAKESASKIHKMDWEVLDLRIKNWLSAVNVAVNTLFHGERILCDQVFASSDSVRELCFNEITKEGATMLFRFPEIVVKNSKKSPEKIFRTLDMYTAIASNWPEIESIFSSESTSANIDLALNSTLTMLRDSVRKALTEFEKSIQKESSRTPDAGAVVHSLTTDVMSFLSRLANYNVLQDILFDYTMPAISSLPESYYDTFGPDEYPTMAVSLHFAWLILVLLCKLDGKSKRHKDVSHSYLFLANNIRYITSKVRTSNLMYLLGDNWISKHEAKVATFATKYERLEWSHVIESLPVNPKAVSPEKAKESFKRFNLVFEEAHQKQSAYVIHDNKLRDDIKLSIANKLLPLYREFYYAHGIQMRRERRFAHVVRYTPEDLGHALSDLFFGSGSSSTSFPTSTLVLPVASRS